MKLIVDIPEKVYDEVQQHYLYMHNETVANAISDGVSFNSVIDDIKAKIQKKKEKCRDSFNVDGGMAYEDVLEIIDKCIDEKKEGMTVDELEAKIQSLSPVKAGTLVKLESFEYLTRPIKLRSGGLYQRVFSEISDAKKYAGKKALVVDVTDNEYALYFPFNNTYWSWFDRDQFDVLTDLVSDYR